MLTSHRYWANLLLFSAPSEQRTEQIFYLKYSFFCSAQRKLFSLLGAMLFLSAAIWANSCAKQKYLRVAQIKKTTDTHNKFGVIQNKHNQYSQSHTYKQTIYGLLVLLGKMLIVCIYISHWLVYTITQYLFCHISFCYTLKLFHCLVKQMLNF